MNAVQCDQCGDFAANPDTRLIGRYTNEVPEGWYVASAWTKGADEASLTGEFCSLECVSDFFRKASRA